MNGHGQGFNKTREGKLFKLSESNFNIGSFERHRRLSVKVRYDTAKLCSEMGSILTTVDRMKRTGY